jgi:hypothetical protein
MAILGLAVLLTVWPGISGFAIAPRWALLAIAGPALLCFTSITMTRAHWAGLGFLAYATISLAWAPVAVEAWQGLAHLIILAILFCLGAELDNPKPLYKALALGMAVNAIFVIPQLYGHSWVEQVSPPAGLFANKNMLGEAAALALIACYAGRLSWPYWLGPLFCVAAAQCWGAFAAVGVAAALAAGAWSKVATVVILIAMLLAAHFALSSERRQNSIIVRGWIAMDAIGNLKWLGHGVGQYWVTTPENAPRQQFLNVRHWHAHNDALELIYEYGIGSAFYFAFVVLCLMAAEPGARLLLAGFLVEGLFGFPLFIASTAFIAVVVAGFAAGSRNRLRGPVDERADHRRSRHARAWGLRNQDEQVDYGGVAFSARSLPARAAGARGGSLFVHAAEAGGA